MSKFAKWSVAAVAFAAVVAGIFVLAVPGKGGHAIAADAATVPAPLGADIPQSNAPAAQPAPAVNPPAPPVVAAPTVTPPPAPAPVAQVPAPLAPAAPAPANNAETLQTVEAPASPDCKLVKVYRPDVNPSYPNIVVRFQDLAKANAVAKIADCDQKASGSSFLSIQPWTTRFPVKFATTDGTGMVNLPIGLTDGSANQVVCSVDWATKTITHAKYMRPSGRVAFRT